MSITGNEYTSRRDTFDLCQMCSCQREQILSFFCRRLFKRALARAVKQIGSHKSSPLYKWQTNTSVSFLQFDSLIRSDSLVCIYIYIYIYIFDIYIYIYLNPA